MNTTLVDALRIISKEVEASGIPVSERACRILSGADPITPNTSFCFEVRSSFSVGCTLYVDFNPDWDRCRKDPDNDHITARVQLNWASTHRSISNAQASIALYQKMTNLGATIDAAFEGVDIIYPKNKN